MSRAPDGPVCRAARWFPDSGGALQLRFLHGALHVHVHV